MWKVFILLCFWVENSDESPTKNAEQVKIAAEMKSFMNESVNPCEDFYEFACGNFADKMSIPDDMIGISTVSEMSANIYRQIEDILSVEIEDSEHYEAKIAKRFFKMCMDEGEQSIF
jgi:predicted metalloendopeptidase